MAAACEIPYIKNGSVDTALSATSEDELKDILQEVHLRTLQSIAGRVNSKNELLFNNTVSREGVYLKVLSSEKYNSKQRREQIAALNAINTQVKTELKAKKIFNDVPDSYDPVRTLDVKLHPGSTLTYSVVVVDFTPYISSGSRILEEADFENIDPMFLNQYFQKEYYEPNYIKTANVILDSLQRDPVIMKETLDGLSEMLNNIETYAQNIYKNSSQVSNFSRLRSTFERLYSVLLATEREYNELLETGATPSQLSTKAIERISHVTSFLRSGHYVVGNVKYRMDNTVSDLMDKINSLNNPEYYKDIEKLGKILKEVHYIMNTLSPLKDLLSRIPQELNYSFWDSYNVISLERELIDLFRDKENGMLLLEDIFNSDIQDIDTIKYRMLTHRDSNGDEVFTSSDVASIDSIFTKNLVSEKNKLIHSFKNFNNDFLSLESTIRDSMYNYIATIIHNEYIRSMKVKDISELTPEQISQIRTKEQIIENLKVATSDIGLVESFFQSGQSWTDEVLRIASYYVDRQLMVADFLNVKKQGENEKILEDFGFTVEDKDGRRAALESQFIEKKTYVPNTSYLEEADQEWLDKGLPTLSAYGKTFKASERYGFIEEYSIEKFKFLEAAFNRTKEERIDFITSLLTEDINNPVYIDVNSLTAEDIEVLKMILVSERDVKERNTPLGTIIYFQNKELPLRENISRYLSTVFWNSVTHLRPKNEILQELRDLDSIADAQDLVDKLNSGIESDMISKVLKNTYTYKLRTTKNIKRINHNLFDKQIGTLFGADILIGVNSDGKYFVVDPSYMKKRKGSFEINHPDIEEILVMVRDFTELDASFKNPAYQTLQSLLSSNQGIKEYHDFIYGNYKVANDKLGIQGLKYGFLPSIAEVERLSTLDKIKRKAREAVDLNTDDLNYNPSGRILKDGTILELQEDDSTLKILTPKHVNELKPGLQQSLDLFMNNMHFDRSTRMFEALSNSDAFAKIFLTLLKGSESGGLHIKERVANVSDSKLNTIIKRTVRQKFEEHDLNSTRRFEEWMESKIYGYKKDYRVLGSKLSVQKLSNKIKMFNAYTLLANNQVAMLTNIGIATIENFSAAAGRRFGLKSKALLNSYKEVIKHSPSLLADLAKRRVKDMSLTTQLVYAFDAIKGNNTEGIIGGDPTETGKIAQMMLYYTQSLPEAFIQTSAFLALLRSYTIIEGHGNEPALKMNDLIIEKDGEMFTFDLDKYNKRRVELGKEEVTLDEFIDVEVARFKGVLTKFLEETQGMYDKYQKNSIENHVILSLSYQFHRWLYPGIKARYKKGGIYNPYTGEYDEEGYMRTFLKSLIKQWDEEFSYVKDYAFLNRVREYLRLKNITKTAQLSSNIIAKAALGPIVKLSKDLLGIQNPNIDEWLFSEEHDEAVRDRISRSYRYLLFWTSTFVMMGITRALAEYDGDDDDLLLEMLELQAKRINSDMGFFINPITAMDKALMKYRDPFTIYKSYSSLSGIFKQAFFFEYNPGDVDPMNWKFNDVYEHSGPGYEKGDYKLWVKFRKTFLSPYNQYIRALNPDEQLKYMEMVYNN